MGRGRIVTVLGFVDPHIINDDGKVTCVSIAGEGQRYVVLPVGKGRHLTRHVDAEIQVSGIVRKIDGVSYLDVLSYEGACYDLPEDEEGFEHLGPRGGF